MSIDRIEHVVFLMMENRSFDSLLGWLYDTRAPAKHIPALKQEERPYEGLSGLRLQDYENISERVFVAGGSHLTCFGVDSAAQVYYLDVSNRVNCLSWDRDWHNDVLPGQAAAGSALACYGKGVYYLDSNNRVNKLRWDSGSWDNETLRGQAAAGSALACYGIGVYYLDSNDKVHQLGWDSGHNSWQDEALPGQAAAGSALACFGVGGTASRVYYLDSNNKVHELSWDSGRGWHNETLPGQAAAGSALACFGVGGKASRVYYLDSNNKVNQLAVNGGGWKNELLPGQAAAGSALACFGERGYARVYYLDSNNQVNELAWRGDNWEKNPFIGSWPEQHFGGPATQAAAGSALACWVGGTEPRVYYLDSNNRVKELAWVVESSLRTEPPTYIWNKSDVAAAIFKASPTTGAKGLGVPNIAPGEKFHEVNTQLFENEYPGPQDRPTMKGYVRDFTKVLRAHGLPSDKVQRYADQVMQCYLPVQLPVLNGLAEHYAVCDMWFSSVPSQTNPNRAFALCGTSMGLVDNGFLEEDPRRIWIEKQVGYKLGDDRFKTDTIFNALEGDGKTTWKIFGRSALLQKNIAQAVESLELSPLGPELKLALGDKLNYLLECSAPDVVSSDYTYRLFPNINNVQNAQSHFDKIDDFHVKARAGQLPNFSYIEPDWTIAETGTGAEWWRTGVKELLKILLFHQGNDYHPPGNLDAAENLVKEVYNSLIANRQAWEKTLLLITFDEPVGSFDHVPPPAAIPPWGEGKVPGFTREYDFNFDRYGGRVPAIVVSPLVEKGTVFRSETHAPFDHTSIIKTILKWRGLENRIPDFGERTKQAPTFENVVTLSTARTDEREVSFLKLSRKAHEPVHFYDRFYLKTTTGEYVSGFTEKRMNPFIELASTDPTSIEYFPRLASTPSAPFYFQLVKDRPTSAEITADGQTEVRLVTTDDGVGAYNVLGKWKDSPDCYYFNDYLEGEHSDQETWILEKPDKSKLLFGDQVTITNKARNSRLIQSADKLTCSNQPLQYWTIEPLPPRYDDLMTRVGTDLAPAGGASGDPAGYVRSDKINSVVYRGTNNHIYEAWLRDGVWHHVDLTARAGAPDASGDPAGYARSDGINSVVYRGKDNHIYELHPQLGAWISTDLSGAKEASGDPAGYVRSDRTTSVVYRGANNHIYQLYLEGGSWHDGGDLTQLTGAPAALGDPTGCARSDGTTSVVYRGANNHIYELYLEGGSYLAGGSWHYGGDLTQLTGAPAALGDPTGYVGSDRTRSVVYRGENNHIYELIL